MITDLIVGGIKTARMDRQELADLMVEDCMAARLGRLLKPKVLIASNGSVIARYHSDAQFRRNVDRADLVDADGMPLVLASRFFCRTPLVERVATTDFIEDAAAAAAKSGLRFYFLGGKPGVAEKAARKLTEKYPGLQIAGTQHGYFSASDESAISADILAKKADVLWIGLGSPHQEALAIRLRDELPGVGWIRTCGGLFDHVSEAVPRDPAHAVDGPGMAAPPAGGAPPPRLALHHDEPGGVLPSADEDIRMGQAGYRRPGGCARNLTS
jgi:N-acetylglucosaminyldiphosphoundecaprenol N-acetyl-beta-D-mannosaminyltransferase